MREVWEAKAAEIGFDPATLADVVGRVPARPAAIERDEILDELVSEVGLTRQASSFTRRDVLRSIAERVPAGATVAQIEDMADDLFARPDLVRLVETDGPGLLATSSIRRRDGKLVAGGVDETRWSTAELVDLEQRLMARAVARHDRACGLVDDEVLDAVLDRRPTLSGEQVDDDRSADPTRPPPRRRQCGGRDRQDLHPRRRPPRWESAGYRVIGAALAGRAAEELQSSAAIPSTTLDQAQRRPRRPARPALDAHTVVVIDESGMAGTRLLAPVLDAADRAGAKVVLVGDPKQLSEIDAGGVFRGLTARLGAIELVENRRQQEQWERDALEQLRSGDVEVAFAEYDRNGRVVTAATAPEVRTAMVADWWSHRLAGDDVAMMAVRRSDVDDLNGRAHAYLVRAGKVSGPELVIDERPYQAGDTRDLPQEQPPARRAATAPAPPSPTSTPSGARSRSTPSPTSGSCSRPSTSRPATSPTPTPPRSTRPRAPPSTGACCSAPTSSTASAATSA